MSIELITLLVLVVVIAIGFVRNINVGLLAIVGAALIGYFTGLYKDGDIIKGFSSSLFLTLFGLTFLFGIVQKNGVLEKISKTGVKVVGKNNFLIPIMIYIIGLVVSAIGPGCIPALVLIAAIAIPLAHRTGYNPIMLMLIGDSATYAGRFTSITPEGILINKLLGDQNIHNVIFPIFMNALGITAVLSIVFFIAYKGYAVKPITNIEQTDKEVNNLSKNDIYTLCGMVFFILLVTVLKINVGLAGFIAAALLLLLKVESEKEIFKLVPMGTIIMVTGVGVLMNLVIASGGIKVLANAMSSVMNPTTAPAITGLTAGVMSWFSSTIGVVMPTLLPTIGTIITNVGSEVSASELATVLVVTSSFAGFSPASTVGAIIIAACAGDKVFSQMDSRKIFVSLFAWSAFCVAIIPLVALTGIFGIIK